LIAEIKAAAAAISRELGYATSLPLTPTLDAVSITA
jgi:hypothetical protein